MTASEFREWLKAMGIKGSEAARLLGVSANTVTRWKRDGAPKVVELACKALFHRLSQ